MTDNKPPLDPSSVLESTKPSLGAVSVKLPLFWSAQPRVWFAQTEAQFVLRGISLDETKYYYVVAALDQDSAKRVVDLIDDPPVKNKYPILKDRLLSTFTLSPYRMAKSLLNMAPLGDRQPSQLMDDMLALIGKHDPCILFRTIFVELLPAELRPHLIPTLESTPPRELAALADHLIASNVTISAIRKKSPGSFKEERPVTSGWCRLHRKWGPKAFRCEPPCTFGQSKISSVQGNLEDGHQ